MSDDSNLQAEKIVAFGPFCLTASKRLLERDGQTVVIGSRSLDILIALIEGCGEVVSRRELIKRVWPDLVVEESNLRQHIAILRKVLGEGVGGARYIANVPGRGYCFVTPIQRVDASPPLAPQAGSIVPISEPLAPPPAHRLPMRLARMICREETVAALSALLRSHRFVSVVGTGGIGKTTVAISVAHALLDNFGNTVYFVDLGAHTDAALIPGVVATVVGLKTQVQNPLSGLLRFLSGRRVLLVLDNCEHVIDAVAALTEHIYNEAPQVHLLTTSREALRVEGEYVHLLHPLGNPPEGVELTADLALKSPAVQLFMERAAASGHSFDLSDSDASVVAGICRRLDGIALAIELVASRVGTYGIRGTADVLNNRFKLLWQGRRSALPRHQTLHAMLDWSYNLLTERDRRVLCKLSAFAGLFTLAAAQAVAHDAELDALDAADAVVSLVDKSLIWVSSIGGAPYYRLLDITRTFAAAKLAESLEGNLVAKRHALYYSEKLREEAITVSGYGGRDLSACILHLSNIRAALEWSFSGAGDTALGVELAARSTALFLGLSLLGECRRWCEQGLAALDENDRGGRRELELQQALAFSAMFAQGNGDEVRGAIDRGLGLAETMGERPHQLHLLAGLHMFLMRIGNFREGLEVAERSVLVAQEIGDPGSMVMADWMLGCAYHLIGNQEGAQRHSELGFKRAADLGEIDIHFFGYDHRGRALIVLARVLWLRGFPERAHRVARRAIDEAERRDYPVNLCIALLYTTTVFLWRRDFEQAAARIEQLLAHAAKHSLGPYRAVGLALKGELAVARGQADTGVKLLRSALAILHAEQYHVLSTTFYRALAEGLVQCGEVEEAATAVNTALSRAQHGGETFDMPDLLRARGDVFMAAPQPDIIAAEKALLGSIACAQNQSSLSLELRAAIALARLWMTRERSDEARELLWGIYQRFSEGFDTADLKSAAQLLEKLGHVWTESADQG